MAEEYGKTSCTEDTAGEAEGIIYRENDVIPDRIHFIDNRVKDASSILILGHVRPDGDAVGSTLGLYNYLKDNYPDKKLTICLGDYSADFKMLSCEDQVLHELPKNASFDMAIACDTSSLDRLGDFADAYFQAPRRICVDHHVTNPGYAQESVVEAEASSASEVLYTLLDPERISLRTAECLYLGIVHDTGVFKHSTTHRSTMEIAGILLEKGVSSSQVIDGTFYHKTYNQNQILGQALINATLELDGKVIVSLLTREEMDRYHATSVDLDGIIDQLRVTEGCEVAVLINESMYGDCKVSMRSTSTANVSEVASQFGGGGHVKAAGCTVHGKAEEVKKKLLPVIATAL